MERFKSKLSPTQQLDNLFGSLADDIVNMSDEEILQECREMGEDPDQIASEVKALIDKVLVQKGEKP